MALDREAWVVLTDQPFLEQPHPVWTRNRRVADAPCGPGPPLERLASSITASLGSPVRARTGYWRRWDRCRGEAAAELEYCVTAHRLKVIEVLAHVRDKELSDETFRPFRAKVEESGAMVHLPDALVQPNWSANVTPATVSAIRRPAGPFLYRARKRSGRSRNRRRFRRTCVQSLPAA
jgi:hypothetical protein